MKRIAFSLFLTSLLPLLGWAAGAYRSAGFVEFPDSVKLGAVSSVAVDAKGAVYILHRGEPPLVAFDRSGRFRKGFGEGLFKVAHGIRIDRHGHIWTTDNGNHVLRQFSPEGELLRTLGEVGVPGADDAHFKSPDDMIFARGGDIYVADAGNVRIVHLSADGKFLSAWGQKGKGPSEFSLAHSLAIDGDDRLFVGDRGNNRIQVFDKNGKFETEWKDFGNPFGILYHGGELIVSDGDANRILHLNKSGKVVASWGDGQMLKLPHFMAVSPNGVLYVAEVNGKRVQKFRK